MKCQTAKRFLSRNAWNIADGWLLKDNGKPSSKMKTYKIAMYTLKKCNKSGYRSDKFIPKGGQID